MFYRALPIIIACTISLANIKLGYKETVWRSIFNSQKSQIINERSILTGHNLLNSINTYSPILSATGSFDSQKNSNGKMSIRQTFTSGASAALNYDLEGNKSLEISQPILKSFRQNDKLLNNSYDEFKKSRLSQIIDLQNIAQEALSSYWQVVSSEKQREVQIIGKKSAEKLYQQYKIKVKMGILPKYTLDEQKAQMERFKLQVIQQKTSEIKARENLKLIINLDRLKKITLTEPLDISRFEKIHNLAEILKTVSKQNLNIKIAEINVAVAKRNYAIAKNNALPELNLNATMANHESAKLGISLSIPFNDPGIKQNITTARSSLVQAELNLSQTKQNKIREVTNLWQELSSKIKENLILRKNLKISQDLYNLTKKLQRLGKASSLDIITRQKTYVADQQAIILNEISYLKLYMKILAEENKLLQQFNIFYRESTL